MAEALTPAPAAAPPAGPPPERPYRRRFVVAFVVLGVLLAAAAVGAVIIAMGDSAKPDVEWSSWEPTRSGSAGATEIATHLGPRYRLDDNKQLAAVRSGLPALADRPAVVAVSRTTGDNTNDVQFVDGAPTIYLLCGLGDRCAIRGKGKPSQERAVLLRREALELALYSFRYLDPPGPVVVFLPPKPGSDPTLAMMFRRSDLQKYLDRPLADTLALVPPKPKSLGKVEQSRLLSLTQRYLYQFSFQQAQDGTVVIVLDQPQG